MGTLASGAAKPTAPRGYAADQPFFVRLAAVLAAVTLTGFILNAAMGRVDISAVPMWVHLHGAAMVAWLALFVTQNRLAAQGRLALHRQLGWAGAVLVCAIVALTSFSGVMAVAMHRQPPFFSAPYFLVLVQMEALSFAAMVLVAIRQRRDTQTHRRLMFGATIIAADPGISRILPMPLLGPAGTWLAMAAQLAFVGAIALHDRKVAGRVHAATIASALVIALVHLLVALAARTAPVIALAQRIAG